MKKYSPKIKEKNLNNGIRRGFVYFYTTHHSAISAYTPNVPPPTTYYYEHEYEMPKLKSLLATPKAFGFGILAQITHKSDTKINPSPCARASACAPSWPLSWPSRSPAALCCAPLALRAPPLPLIRGTRFVEKFPKNSR